MFEMIPLEIKNIFENSTTMEQLLISPIIPVMSINRLSSGHLKNTGYCASFVQDMQPICKFLPRLANDVSVLIVKQKDKDNNIQEYTCRRNYVEKMLNYLIENHPFFILNKIQINKENLELLPMTGVPTNLPIINEEENNETIQYEQNEQNIDSDLNEEYMTINEYIDIDEIDIKEKEKIKQYISLKNISETPINEYNVQGIYSLAFPTLFPFGLADPTDVSRLILIKEQEGIQHLIKYANLDSNGKLYYPFAKHSRFLFYAHDRIKRHTTLKQCKVYLKQNPKDANLTVQDIQNMNSKNFFVI